MSQLELQLIFIGAWILVLIAAQQLAKRRGDNDLDM